MTVPVARLTVTVSLGVLVSYGYSRILVGGRVVFDAELGGVDEDAGVAIALVVVALQGDGVVALGLGEDRHRLRCADGGSLVQPG